MTDDVRVGTCDAHVGVHVEGTHEDDGSGFCQGFTAIPGFVHECSEDGNLCGGYDCTCGSPWLESLGGCMVAPREAR
jgi:hypothetical protein